MKGLKYYALGVTGAAVVMLGGQLLGPVTRRVVERLDDDMPAATAALHRCLSAQQGWVDWPVESRRELEHECMCYAARVGNLGECEPAEPETPCDPRGLTGCP